MPKPSYNDSVFINCPFDDDYREILRAIVYAVYRCGFYPQTALDEDDGTEIRLLKIIRKMRSCRYGIHDLSRIELNPSDLPRFNMPFELGIFFGAKYFGDIGQNRKNALVLERTRYTYQQFISDLNGIDTKAHNNNPVTAMLRVHSWLNTASRRKTIPGETLLRRQYDEFSALLPETAAETGYAVDDIPFLNLLDIIQEIVARQLTKG
ncbi:MAG TPA: hypothetical protein VGR89_00805 [Puia sp.]|nr:hypothetical protein [Puia sp.]